jgi:hypothetical protein
MEIQNLFQKEVYKYPQFKQKETFNQILANDITGIKKNMSWFEKQLAYIESLDKTQKEIIDDYSNYGAEMGLDGNEEKLVEIIKNAPRLDHRLVVWSGRTRRDSARLRQKNKIYKNPRFISSSIFLDVADRFAFAALYKIILLKNSHCLFIQTNESEILLPKNNAFYIVDRTPIIQYKIDASKKKIVITSMIYLNF